MTPIAPLVRLPHLTAAPLVPARVAFRSRAQGLKTVQPHSRPGGKRSAVGPSHRGVEAATAVATNAHAGAAAITAPGPAVRNVAHRICVTHPTPVTRPSVVPIGSWRQSPLRHHQCHGRRCRLAIDRVVDLSLCGLHPNWDSRDGGCRHQRFQFAAHSAFSSLQTAGLSAAAGLNSIGARD
jgi:hypothetical protein